MNADKTQESLIPPHSLEAEKAVLGAVLRDAESLTQVVESLRPEFFFLDAHGRIFSAMIELFSAGESADILTVAEKLRGGTDTSDLLSPSYLVELTENCPVVQNIDHYAAIVRRHFFMRRLVNLCQETTRGALASDGSLESYVEGLEKGLMNILNEQDRRGIIMADAVLESTIEELQKNIERGDGITGVPSGFYEIDALTGGWQPSDLIILAARPGMGKTAFALNCVCNAIKGGKSVVFFTLEMKKEQLMSRVLAAEARIDASKLRKGELSGEELDRLMEGARRIHSLSSKFGIDESAGISLLDIRSRCRRFQRERGGLDLIVIDYLQLIKTHSRRQDNREREISEISMGLKELAKECNVPVIALAQLNRQLEARPDKRPRPSDLRESGSLEQDADQIVFIYRDDVYNPASERMGVAEIIFGKNRHGPCKPFDLAYLPSFVSFQNLMRQ